MGVKAEDLILDKYEFGFADEERPVFKTERGLTREIVEKISEVKGEPAWMLEYRLKAYDHFMKRPMPNWGDTELMSQIKFDEIFYYFKPVKEQGRTWDDVPDYIKNTFDKLGIPEAERKFLGGVGAQYDSEVVYHNIQGEWEEQGVIFLDMDSGLREHPELVKEYFGTIIPYSDNKFSALNSAVWSGGSFIYVPPGVSVKLPLQTYFRINAKSVGQFERTLIIVDEGAEMHYVEGCTAPTYAEDSLHSAVVEILVKKGGRCQYTTIQNWSKNVFNLVTKRAVAMEDATMCWLDGNLGSKLTMKYPAIFLRGRGAHAEILSVAFAGEGQHQDAGCKVVHAAPDTTSTITAKSLSKNGGKTTFRGLIKATKNAHGARIDSKCDALILDNASSSDTIPYLEFEAPDMTVEHEATVSKVSDDQLFYLQSRGISENEAKVMIVNGFIQPIVKELPMEYAVELNRLVELEMEGSVG
jgi:Fe-S cluster assembly protein SufB